MEKYRLRDALKHVFKKNSGIFNGSVALGTFLILLLLGFRSILPPAPQILIDKILTFSVAVLSAYIVGYLQFGPVTWDMPKNRNDAYKKIGYFIVLLAAGIVFSNL